MTTKVEIGKEVGRGWELFKANMGLLIITNILMGLLCFCTCYILAGPMLAGQILIIQRLLKKDPTVPVVGDVFKGFDYFLNAFLCVLVMAVILALFVVVPVVNAVASMVLSSLSLIAIMFVAFGKLSFSDAMKKVMSEIKTGPFWMLILTFVVALLIGSLGIFVFGIGALFTMPLFTCICVCAYHTAYEGATDEPPPLIDPLPPAEPAS